MSGQQKLFRQPPKRRRIGRTRRGLDGTLKALRDLGRLERIDAGLIALCRVAADELDAAVADPDESRYTRGVLVARYHAVLSHLIARPDVPDDGDDLEAMFAALANDPPA